VKEERRFRTVNVATLNKIIEDFSHLPLDDKEYAVNNISKLIYKKRKKFLVFRRKEEKGDRLL
jgi:hypothetical protein